MEFKPFSRPQLTLLTWWSEHSPDFTKDAVICDGAVRSGKTLCMGLSFICWAMRQFEGARFGLCGKTVGSLRRNLLSELLPTISDLGFSVTERVARNEIEIGYDGKVNTFYCFGGKDEGSASLIQGVTLAGVLLDEVALMPRAFVEQACARCSVEGSRFWFNCNPEGSAHWFYTEWIKKSTERNALYIHFDLEDNPALSRSVIARYHNMYSGVFYRRFILGEWVSQEGLVYDFYDPSTMAVISPPETCLRYVISCDYGTANPASFGLWGKSEGIWYRLREFYYDSKREGRQMTDAEYTSALRDLHGDLPVDYVVVDPSAASFIESLRRENYRVRRANNEVIGGIRRTAVLLGRGDIRICTACRDTLREIALYHWDERSEGRDAPLKRDDHAMDDMRYFVMSISEYEDNFISLAVER